MKPRRALERLEHAPLVGLGYPDALIEDREASDGPVPVGDDPDRLSGAVLHGVREQVRRDLLEPQPIPLAHDGAFRLHVERTSSQLGLLAQPPDDVPHEGRQIHRLTRQGEPPLLDAREVEQAVDQQAEPADLALERRERRRQPGRGDRLLLLDRSRERVELQMEACQRRLQLVGEERRAPLRGLRRRPRLALPGEQERVLEGDGRLRGEQLEGEEPLGRERVRGEVVLEVEQAEHLGLPQDGNAEDRPRIAAGRCTRRPRTCRPSRRHHRGARAPW